LGRLFGTDGIRGLANADLTAEIALEVAVSAAHILSEADGSRRRTAVVGRDPRASGEFLSAAVIAGLSSAGMDVADAGVVPTPALAFLTADLGADLGVMLSASHNPAPDNGIKLFAAGGRKLPDAVEDAIEDRLNEPWERPTGAAVGRVRSLADGGERYLEHLLAAVPNSLNGLRIVVDGANGAASLLAPEALRRAGADVIAIGCDPDGININHGCGSTHLEPLQRAVRDSGADLGLAHDGDADRCLAVAADGSIVDGDQILAMLALALHESGHLVADTVVATVMSNLGLKLALQAHGIVLEQTAVGDRYVLERMVSGGFALGGEQSGHVILAEYATTGDGLLTGLLLAARVAATGRSLADLAAVVQRLPQVLINVTGVDRAKLAGSAEVADAVAVAEAELGDTGRVLLRPSGTEPVVRVMVEAPTEDDAESVAGRLAQAVRAALS
jgi:phosphoglucosamine mutase